MQEGLKLTWKDKQTTRQDKKNKDTKPTQNEPKNKNKKTNQKNRNNTKQNKEEITVYYYVAQYNLL